MSKTILVVEDQHAVRRVVVRMLRAAGFDVLEAANGEEALILLKNGPRVDVVVTDITMPEMGGIELEKRLSLAASPVPVLFITGRDQDPALLPGPLLPKPFKPEELVAEVRRLLSQTPAPGQDRA